MAKEIFRTKTISEREKTLSTVTNYVANTVESKALYKKGGWKSVREKYTNTERFNPNFSISATAICAKLRANREPINLRIQANMKVIEGAVNSLLGIKAVEYRVDRKNHTLTILL